MTHDVAVSVDSTGNADITKRVVKQIHSSAAISNPGAGVMHVTTSPNAIINWQGFSTAQGELTRFLQQNANSAVLNRVISQNPSAILGQLLSNGRVFLINPNRIVFGQNAVVDTQGLIASTLNISNEDFLAGRYHFAAGANAGSIENQGFIRSGPNGEVILIAPSIENSGIIQADDGNLILAVGRSVTFTSLDVGGLQFELQSPEDEVLNVGQLIADRGTVGGFASNLANTGRIQARGIGRDKLGRIVVTVTNYLVLGDAPDVCGGVLNVTGGGTVDTMDLLIGQGTDGQGLIRDTGTRLQVSTKDPRRTLGRFDLFQLSAIQRLLQSRTFLMEFASTMGKDSTLITYSDLMEYFRSNDQDLTTELVRLLGDNSVGQATTVEEDEDGRTKLSNSSKRETTWCPRAQWLSD